MTEFEALLKAWEEAAWEFTLVFEGLEDQDLWVRPHPSLLSIGELTGHVTNNEATLDAGLQVSVKSPLIDDRFYYYLNNINTPIVLDLTVEQALNQFKEVHEEAVRMLRELNPDLNAHLKGRTEFTWAAILRYRAFHLAYHTGQAYSLRHLMGHVTTDN